MVSKGSPRLLLADNAPDYRHSLATVLRLKDYEVLEAKSVEEAVQTIADEQPVLALIDLRLTNDDDDQDVSGLEVAKFAREKGIPCIIITSFPSIDTMRLALASVGVEALADDVIPKVQGSHAIIAAIEVLLIQHRNKRNKTVELLIDPTRKLVWLKGQQVQLSRNQYALLAYMDGRQGTVCSHSELLKALYDEYAPEDQASADKRLERLIARVRAKIEDDKRNPKLLLNVPGRGYLLRTNG